MPTNYVYIKKNGNIVYPKTKLSAIDMTLCNGLQITGETMSLSAATALQVKQGATGRVVMADGLKEAIATYSDALYIPGDGFAVSGGTIGLVSANTYEVLTVAEGTERLPIDNKNLNGAMNLGRAVDVSSAVNHNTFTSATSQNGVTTLAVSSASATTYYYGWNTQYPKFAAGLKYLIMADYMCPGDQVTAYLCSHATADRGIVAGVPYSTTTTSSSQYTRLASVFTTSNNVGFFISRGSASNIQIKLKNFKVFEVTALNDEAISALASAENPDAVYEKFLVKQDAVCPWISIINMADSPALTIGAGLAYSLEADDGEVHELYVDTFPEGAYGREAYLTLFVGETGSVHVNSPLVLMDPLTANAVNNCVIRFRDGYARMYVLDTDYGYAVTVNSGTTDGSLYYGLVTDTSTAYISFSGVTDEQDVILDVSGVTLSHQKSVTGNGTDKTTVNFNNTGMSVGANVSLQFTNLTVKDGNLTSGSLTLNDSEIANTMTVTGGVLILNNTHIPSGSTVAVNGGTLSVKKLTGDMGDDRCEIQNVTFSSGVRITDTGVDLGGDHIVVSSGGTTYASGCTFASGGDSTGTNANGTFYMYGTASAVFTNCDFTLNRSSRGGVISLLAGASATLNGCKFYSNIGGAGKAVAIGISMASNRGGTATITGCSIGTGQHIRIADASCSLVCSDRNSLLCRVFGTSGTVTLTSGAVLDLTGNTNATPIAPGGGITFASGGATVIASDGTPYMLGGVTVPRIGNTNVINLNSSSCRSVRATTIVSGATITNGYATSSAAGLGRGGFLYASNASVVLIDTAITGCTAYNGGGIFMGDTSANLTNCVISGNSATDDRNGDMHLHSGTSAFINNCVIGRLGFGWGGTLYIAGTSNMLVGTRVINGLTGYAIISSGASLTLVDRIDVGSGNIIVLDGGCTINGSAVPAGSYTSIVSSNGGLNIT